MSPQKRKPVAGKATGSLKIEQQASKFDAQENSPNLHQLQAIHIRERFAVSWPVARAVAELAYGRAA